MKMNYPHEKAVQAILDGYSCAMRLKSHFDDPTTDDRSVTSYDLVKSIIGCFSTAISNLSCKPISDDDSDLSSRDSSPSHSHMSHSKKRKISSTSSSEYWRDDSPHPITYDGFLWRKYGQKNIKGSHQRSYYRCSYNKDHHCNARKHEQMISDDPPVYRTTYFGSHTCKTNHNQDAFFTNVVDRGDDLESAQMIQFGQDLDQDTKKKENHLDGFYLSVKHEDDFNKKERMDQRSGDVINQDVMEEINIPPSPSPSPSGSYPLLSSHGSESFDYASELLLDNLDCWCDRFDPFDYGLLRFPSEDN